MASNISSANRNKPEEREKIGNRRKVNKYHNLQQISLQTQSHETQDVIIWSVVLSDYITFTLST